MRAATRSHAPTRARYDPERLINAVAALSWSPDVVAYSIDPLEEAACAAVGAVVLSAGTPESLIADTLISLGRARRSG